MKRVSRLKPMKTVGKLFAWESFSRGIKASMIGFKKEWKSYLEPRSKLPFVNNEIGKSEEQRFTENDAFAKDRETSFQITMFYKVEIMYSIFYYQNRFRNQS